MRPEALLNPNANPDQIPRPYSDVTYGPLAPGSSCRTSVETLVMAQSCGQGRETTPALAPPSVGIMVCC